MIKRRAVATLLVLAMAACGDDEGKADEAAGTAGATAGSGGTAGGGATGGAAGTAGVTAGSGGTTGGGASGATDLFQGVRLGEYDMEPNGTIWLGPVSGSGGGPPLHLSLKKQDDAIVGALSSPGDLYEGLWVDVNLTRPYKEDASKIDGPLVMSAGAPSSYVAFDLDAQGRPIKAAISGWGGGSGVSCTQNVGGYPYFPLYLVAPDKTAPTLVAQGGPMPWEIVILASEVATLSTPSVTGGTLVSLETKGLRHRPVLGGDLFALLGGSLKLSFTTVSDAAGNVGSGEVSWSFPVLEPPTEGVDYTTGGACKGPQLTSSVGNQKQHAVRLKKPGATQATITVCNGSSPSSSTTVLTVKATASDGKQTSTEKTLMGDESSIDVDLPADDVVLQIDANLCSSVKVEAITLK